MVLEQLDKNGHPPFIKINSKWIINLNVKPKTLKFLKENKRENLCNLGIGKGFSAECVNRKIKNSKIILHQNQKPLLFTDTIKKMTRQHRQCTYKGLVSRIYKEQLKKKSTQ